MLFNNDVKIHDKLKYIPDDHEIKNIPQFYRTDVDMAYRLGGKFIKEFLHTIPKTDYRYISIDTKVHMLKPGWYPCIPGWHCDDFHRVNNIPQLSKVKEDAPSLHYGVVIGKSSFTEFLKYPIELPNEKEISFYSSSDKPIYGIYSDLLDAIIKQKKAETFKVKSGVPFEFSTLDFHRGVQCEIPEWRLFLRVTQSNHRNPKNEIRNQSQVYLRDINIGW